MGLLERLKGAGRNGESAEPRSAVPDVTDDELDHLVSQSDGPVVVDFWAPWCAPCQLVKPAMERIAQSYDGRASIVKVNVDQNTRWTARLGIRGIPTIAFFSKGQFVTQLVGVRREKELRQNLEQLLGSDSTTHPE
jgi:thioredoxin